MVEHNKQTVNYEDRYNWYDFLKPAFFEYGLMFLETPVSLILGVSSYNLSKDWKIGICCAFTPQSLTYLGARFYELFGKRDHIKRQIRYQKRIFRRQKINNLEENLTKS